MFFLKSAPTQLILAHFIFPFFDECTLDKSEVYAWGKTGSYCNEQAFTEINKTHNSGTNKSGKLIVKSGKLFFRVNFFFIELLFSLVIRGFE